MPYLFPVYMARSEHKENMLHSTALVYMPFEVGGRSQTKWTTLNMSTVIFFFYGGEIICLMSLLLDIVVVLSELKGPILT